MNRICNFLILSIIIYSNSYSQSIAAKIVDVEGQPIQGVKVFYDNSSIITYTNDKGIFEIQALPELYDPLLIFYHPQYELFLEPDPNNISNSSSYRLKKRSADLSDSSQRSSVYSSDKPFNEFRKYFIGKGINAESTRILNHEQIILEYNESENIISAKANKPLQIVNDALGYEIEFFLEQFEVRYFSRAYKEKYLDLAFFSGYSSFKELDSTKTIERHNALQTNFNYFFKQIIKENFDDILAEVKINGEKTKPKKIFRRKNTSDGLYKLEFDEPIVSGAQDKFSYVLELTFEDQKVKLQVYNNFLLVNNEGHIMSEDHLDITKTDRALSNRIPIDYKDF